MTTPTRSTIKSQIKLITGTQVVICEKCGKTLNVHVGGVKKDPRHFSYRPYKGGCRHCGIYYTSIIKTSNF